MAKAPVRKVLPGFVRVNSLAMPTVLAMGKSPAIVNAVTPLAVMLPAKEHVPKAARAMAARAPSVANLRVVSVLPATRPALKANRAVPIRKANIT